MNFMRRRRSLEMGNTYDRRVVDGGFDAVFDEPLPDELTCCICFLAFREPMQLSCGHQYCRSCLDKYSKKQGREYTCPTDRLQVAANKMFPDKALERRVLSLGVSCGNTDSGCTWSGELRGLEAHGEECAYTTVECRMCGGRVLEAVVEDHMVNQCGHRVLSCGLCQVDYLFKDEHHHNEMCDRWPVTCTTCNEEVLRGDMDQHILHGCSPITTTTTERDEEDTASTEECSLSNRTSTKGDELRAAVARINVLEKQLEVAEEKNSTLESKLKEQRDELQEHVEESRVREEEMNNRMLKMEEEHKQVVETLAKITASLTIMNEKTAMTSLNIEAVSSRPKRVSNVTPSAPCDEDDHNETSPGGMVPQQYETEVDGVGQNQSRCRKESPRIPNLYSVEDDETDRRTSETNVPQYEQQDICSPPETSMPEDEDQGAQPSEPSSVKDYINFAKGATHGVLVWKVSRYTQKLTEARHTHSYIHSPPFYTSKRGYKIRLQAWLNGQGMGKNTCISLYAQIMQGPYDNELRWPYRLKTTLSILNQQDGAKHRDRTIDVAKEVILDEWRYGRPMSEFNEPFGNSTALITHRNAVSNGYVVDDCVYFMCKVDPDVEEAVDELCSVCPQPGRVLHTDDMGNDCCIF